MTGAYERWAQRLLKGQPRPGRTAWFDGRRLLTGTKSLHLTPQSRTWRLFWRLKTNRVEKQP